MLVLKKSLSALSLHVTPVMVSAVTVTVSTWRLVMRLKLVKQLEPSLPNLSGNLVHSWPCVPSTRVGLPQIPISLKVFLVSKKSLKPAIQKGKRSSLRSKGKSQPLKKMLLHGPRKSLFVVRQVRENTLSLIQPAWKSKWEIKYLVVLHWQKGLSNQNVSLPFVMSCLLKLTSLRKYKKYTVAKGWKSVTNTSR